MKINFRAKVTLMVVSLIVLTTVTVSIATLPRVRNLLIDNQLLELDADTEVQSIRLTSNIEALNNDIIFLSRVPEVQGVLRAIEAGGVDPIDLTTDALWRTQLVGIFTELLLSKPYYTSLHYISADENNLELVNVSRTEESVQVLGRRELRINVSDDYFINAQSLDEGSVFLSNIRLEQANDDVAESTSIILYASTPIYSDDGSVFGVIAVGMDFGAVFNEMLSFVEDEQNLYITNEAGIYLFNSANPQRIFELNNESQNRIQDDFQNLGLAFESENLITEVSASTQNTSNDDAIHFNKVLYDPLNPDRNFGIAVTTPYSEIVGQVDNFIFQAVIIFIVLALVGSLITFVIARILIRPLDEITDAATQISKGNFNVNLPIESDDEFGQLATAFNRMTSAIQERQQDLSKANVALEERYKETLVAQQEAERANQVKSMFLASVSHELRTPLNAILNFSGFVAREKMGPINEEQKDALDTVIKSGYHLLNLINDVLDMSKISSGSLEIYETEVHLNIEIDEVVATTHSLIQSDNVQLITDIDPNLPVFIGDRTRIVQIMLNIISNACKFTEEGYIKIMAIHEEGSFVFSVEDTGPGIPLTEHETIFEAFKQTETGLRQGKGTGLGLPISKNLAEAHGGYLRFESEQGEGTTFYLHLPFKNQPEGI